MIKTDTKTSFPMNLENNYNVNTNYENQLPRDSRFWTKLKDRGCKDSNQTDVFCRKHNAPKAAYGPEGLNQ